MLVDEGTTVYSRFMFAPFAWVRDVLFAPIAGVRPFDVCMALLLVYATLTKKTKRGPVRPMRRVLLIAAGTIAASFAYGMVRGGDARAASWQIYLLLTLLLASFTFAAVFETAEHFAGLAKTVVAAGVWHAIMCMLFWLFYIKTGAVSFGAIAELGDYLSTHDDTVLWTVGVGFVLLHVIQAPTARMRAIAAVLIPLLLFAIQLNHRRLAWISLGGVLLSGYFLVPPSKLKRRIRKIAQIAVPVFLLYTLVGWGRPEGIFRPLRAFETVSSKEDGSTRARNVENLGLIATANQGWLLGTGWGHKYVEVSSKYAIHGMELWPYVPHNSVLGMFAYTGYFGFLGYWMTFPMAAYFLARTARLGVRPVDRLVGAFGVMQIVAVADQWYGDMGSFSSVTNYTLATCFAAAMRVPVDAGVWSATGGVTPDASTADADPADPAAPDDAPAPSATPEDPA
jgi:O-Antigen ligase